MTQHIDVPVRDAATVILLRDTANGPEAFTMERALTMNFSAGATVFPGGKVDATDTIDDRFFQGTDISAWQRSLGAVTDQTKRILIAAVRETFEEVGVLFAHRTNDTAPVDPQQFEAERAGIEAGQLSFAEFLYDNQLMPDFTPFRPWSRWITPAGEARRYDTHFLLAAFPAGQEARLVTEEATSAAWLRPQEAIRMFQHGSTFLMPPTWAQFDRLQNYQSVEAALAASSQTSPIQPEIVRGAKPLRVSFPGSEGYYLVSPAHQVQQKS